MKQINSQAKRVVGEALSAATTIQDPTLSYSIEVPAIEGSAEELADTYGGDEAGGQVVGGFREATFGDPVPHWI